MYDRSGQLFNNYTSWMYYADRPNPTRASDRSFFDRDAVVRASRR
jgi:hypothetical protein